MDLTSFNDAQRECIEELEKNLQVIACAGSGKTKTVVARNMNIIAHQLAAPEEIVSITFTKKAAEELKQRIYTEYEKEFSTTTGLAEMYVGTIHGFCLECLQQVFSEYKKFNILEDVQRVLFVKKYLDDSIIRKIKYTDQKKNVKRPFKQFIADDVKLILSAVDFIREEIISTSGISDPLIDFCNEYISQLKDRCYFDYAQVQFEFYQLLQSSDKLQERIKKIKFITIDEYQDTNNIQEKILEEIFKINPLINICVVGDDDQTIYAWRGSDFTNFSNFPSRYPNVVSKVLSTNYRSSEGIVKLGEHIITVNSGHITKPFDSDNTYSYEAGDITLQTDFSSIVNENDAIVQFIKKIYGSKLQNRNGETQLIDYSDIAILVQSTNKLKEYNQELLDLLEENDIPFIVDGTKQLFEQTEIKIVFDIFLYYAIHYLGMNQGKIEFFSDDIDYTIDKLGIHTFFDDFTNSLTGKYYDDLIQNFYTQMLDFTKLTSRKSEKVVYNLAVFSNIINDYETINFSDVFSYKFTNFVKFLFYDASSIYPEGWLSPRFEEVKCLKIMTIHSSKGLEFPAVIMPHLCKDFLFPTKSPGGRQLEGIFKNILDTAMNIYVSRYKETTEANTRLFYVALTRSKKYLFLSKAISYFKPTGTTEYHKNPNQVNRALGSQYINLGLSTLLGRHLDYDFSIQDEQSKLVFDFSTLKDIFECPRKFQFTSIYGFASALNIRMGYGKSLHNMMDDLHSTYLKDGVILNSSGLVSEHLHLPLAPKTGQLYRDMTSSSIEIVNEYINQNKQLLDHVEYVEKPIDYKLNELIFINGRVDLIMNTYSKDISIIDFKSDSNTMNHDLRNKQLLIYALGYYKLTGVYPNAVISYDLKKNERHPKAITPEDVHNIEIEIDNAYQMIKTKNFPKCGDTSTCKDCQFNNWCK